jgi:hypothetical protein
MWRFLSASSSAPYGADKLFSLNGHQGRQTWEFDPAAGTPEERARVEELRAAFAANRHTQKHRCLGDPGSGGGIRRRGPLAGRGPQLRGLAAPLRSPGGRWEGGRAARAPPESSRPQPASPPATPPRSADELLRLQAAAKVAAKGHAPPAEPLAEGEPVTAERVEQHLKVGSRVRAPPAPLAFWGGRH